MRADRYCPEHCDIRKLLGLDVQMHQLLSVRNTAVYDLPVLYDMSDRSCLWNTSRRKVVI